MKRSSLTRTRTRARAGRPYRLASGVGPVKSEVLTKAGSVSNGITSEQVLRAVTKG